MDDILTGRQPKWMRSVGVILGFEIESAWLRYVVLILPLICLGLAGFFLGAVNKYASIAVLLLGFASVGASVMYWFTELSRKRRVIQGLEKPRHYDATNPDLRDEIILVCTALLLLTPLLLQSLNGPLLDYKVKLDPTGLGEMSGFAKNGIAVSDEAKRFLELQSWSIYSFEALAKNVPIGDWLVDKISTESVVVDSGSTDRLAVGLLQLLFGGFIITIVFGMIQRVGRQLNDAIESLDHSHVQAAAMGPIMIPSLIHILEDRTGNTENVRRNAILALTDIGANYRRAFHASVIGQQDSEAIDRLVRYEFRDHTEEAPSDEDLTKVEELVRAACVLRLKETLTYLMGRVMSKNEYVRTKMKIIKTVEQALPEEEVRIFVSRANVSSVEDSVKKYIGKIIDVFEALRLAKAR